MFCPSCGEDCKDRAKFCSNCGVALSPAVVQRSATSSTQVVRRPLLAFVLSLVAAVGMLGVAFSMSFIDDAPGDIGSQIAGLFHAVGAVQLVLALGVLVSAMLLVVKGFDVKLWGGAIFGLGLVSVAAQLLVVAEGTFAVVFLAAPGVLGIVTGLLARRRPHQSSSRVV